ncbi:hypothetical protein R088_24550 [Salmonella enterica subsp. enterica serovar Heidelberg]|nr:hypothetical protein [Salmonella enterica subsp. enterica serovar Heidelberg]EEK2418840.1 hypothetical protein [Salmonella enterica subsp. enterica serovar Heidelberg]
MSNVNTLADWLLSNAVTVGLALSVLGVLLIFIVSVLRQWREAGEPRQHGGPAKQAKTRPNDGREYLNSLNTGHPGSVTTAHARVVGSGNSVAGSERRRVPLRVADAPAARSGRDSGEGDFLMSAAVGAATNSTLLGWAVGGSLVGAAVGDALVPDKTADLFDSSPSSCDSGSASDSWSSDSGSCSSDDSSSFGDW